MIILFVSKIYKMFEELYELDYPWEKQEKLDEICRLFGIQIAESLKNNRVFYLGEYYGEGHLTLNGTRTKIIRINDDLLIMTLPRLRCRELGFCQMAMPAFGVPFSDLPVKDIVNVCLHEPTTIARLSVTSENLFSIQKKYNETFRELLPLYGIRFCLDMDVPQFCEAFIRNAKHQFFSPYFHPHTSVSSRRRPFTDIYISA